MIKQNSETNREFIFRVMNEFLVKALEDRRDFLVSKVFLEKHFHIDNMIDTVLNINTNRIMERKEIFN